MGAGKDGRDDTATPIDSGVGSTTGDFVRGM